MAVKQITTGQDSFLDIVANLVGILIILVVVVGAQAKVAWKVEEPVAEESDHAAAIEELDQQLEKVASQALKFEIDNQTLQSQILQQTAMAQQLGQQRHEMLVQIGIVEQDLQLQKQQRAEELDQRQRELLELKDKQAILQRELSAIEQSIEATEHLGQPKSEVIEHFPNPIAKTVFTEEVHFQLRRGKIAYVPMDELISRMKSEWKDHAQRLRDQPQLVETVGPIQNFRLQYELIAEMVSQPGPQGPPGAGRIMIQFNGFQLFPASENLGTSVAEALVESDTQVSEFVYALRRYPPGKTTVSLWVYPDSFTEYNQVKNWLYERGYQVACWPLNHDKFISGGPNGFRTSAQ